MLNTFLALIIIKRKLKNFKKNKQKIFRLKRKIQFIWNKICKIAKYSFLIKIRNDRSLKKTNVFNVEEEINKIFELIIKKRNKDLIEKLIMTENY